MAEWFESFFDEVYAETFFDALDDEVLQRAADTLARLLHVEPGARVLDVPCGNGRVTIPLAKMGMAMTGLDFSEPYLEVCRQAARDEGLDLRLVQGDMRRMPFQDEFDGVFNWGGSFGYFSEADNARFCQRMFAALRPGGRCVIDVVNRDWLLANFHPSNELVLHGTRVRQDHRYDEETARYTSTWTYRRGTETRQHDLSMRLYRAEELADLLRSVGFADIELVGGPPPLVALDACARRAIAVARRPVAGGGGT